MFLLGLIIGGCIGVVMMAFFAGARDNELKSELAEKRLVLHLQKQEMQKIVAGMKVK